MGARFADRSRVTRANAAAAVGAAAMTVVLAALRFGVVGPRPPATPYELIPLLIAAAFLCVVGLARRRHPSTAWLATIGAAFTVTIDLAAYARLVGLDIGDDPWRLLGIAISVSAVIAVGAAAGYAASRPRLRRRWLALEGAAALGAIGLAAGWAVANPSDTTFVSGSALGSLGLVTRTFIVLTTGLTLLGLVGDALPAADRARLRARLTAPSTAPVGQRSVAWLRAFTDELWPGRGRARRAVLAERTRVARDIHADVVPSLRRVLADAEHGVPAERLAGSLREVLTDVEAVGAAQHPIQLEIGGIVAALEWLAERVESRSDVTITLNVADPDREGSGEPPAEVAAAAFRVAALALDNVVRHAPGSDVVVDVEADASRVHLTITDDGPGISEVALVTAQSDGRRGLVDMAAEAGESGGILLVTAGPAGDGTCVRFAWPTRGDR
jgi:signal transduction histidine kinase